MVNLLPSSPQLWQGWQSCQGAKSTATFSGHSSLPRHQRCHPWKGPWRDGLLLHDLHNLHGNHFWDGWK